jgi:LPS O-antigen subunit length determinant protein (WzzB/FepE family)
MSISQEQLDIAPHSPAETLADYLRSSISLSELLARAWSGRLIVTLSTVLFLASGAGYVSYSGPKYVATMWVTPAESDSGSGGAASGLLAQLSDSSEASSVPKFTQFLSSIPSTGVAKQLDRKYGMVCRVFRATCDQTTHQWHKETGGQAWIAGITAELARLPDPNGARTANDLAGFIATKVDINQNKKNAIVILTYSDSKPERAAQFLAAVVSSANDYIKNLNHENERQYVAYLADTVSKTTNVEQRQILDTLLLQHERQLMMTEVDVPYAATILEGPSVLPVNHVMKILLAFGCLGFVVGLLVAFFRPRQLRQQHA